MHVERFNPSLALGPLWMALLGLLPVLLSSGCAATARATIPPVAVLLPANIVEACARPDIPGAETPSVGEVLAFTVEQGAALEVCEAKRAAAVAIAQALNEAAQKQIPEKRRDGLRGFLGF